jgi:hypothetical protein
MGGAIFYCDGDNCMIRSHSLARSPHISTIQKDAPSLARSRRERERERARRRLSSRRRRTRAPFISGEIASRFESECTAAFLKKRKGGVTCRDARDPGPTQRPIHRSQVLTQLPNPRAPAPWAPRMCDLPMPRQDSFHLTTTPSTAASNTLPKVKKYAHNFYSWKNAERNAVFSGSEKRRCAAVSLFHHDTHIIHLGTTLFSRLKWMGRQFETQILYGNRRHGNLS